MKVLFWIFFVLVVGLCVYPNEASVRSDNGDSAGLSEAQTRFADFLHTSFLFTVDQVRAIASSAKNATKHALEIPSLATEHVQLNGNTVLSTIKTRLNLREQSISGGGFGVAHAAPLEIIP